MRVTPIVWHRQAGRLSRADQPASTLFNCLLTHFAPLAYKDITGDVISFLKVAHKDDFRMGLKRCPYLIGRWKVNQSGCLLVARQTFKLALFVEDHNAPIFG